MSQELINQATLSPEDKVKIDINLLKSLRVQQDAVNQKMEAVKETDGYKTLLAQATELQDTLTQMTEELQMEFNELCASEVAVREKISTEFPEHMKTVECEAGKATRVELTSMDVNNPIALLRDLATQNENVLRAVIKKVTWNKEKTIEFTHDLGFSSAEYVDVEKKSSLRITLAK